MNDSSDDENAACEADYESDYLYCEEDEGDTMTTGWLSGQKRPSSFLRDKAASMIRSSSMDDLVMSSEDCHRCLQECHNPVSCCTQAASWLQRRHQLGTVSPQVLQECVVHYIHTVAGRAEITEAEAGILCRNQEWRLDLTRIRLNREDAAFLEIMQMGARYMEEMDALDPVIDGHGDAHEADGTNEFNDLMTENGAAAAAAAATPAQIQHDADLQAPVRNSPIASNVNEIEEGTRNVDYNDEDYDVNTEDESDSDNDDEASRDEIDPEELAELLHDTTECAHQQPENQLAVEDDVHTGVEAQDVNTVAARHRSEPATASFGLDGNTASDINTDDAVKMNSSEPNNSVPKNKQLVNLVLTCPICLDDDLVPESMYAMECGHMFCVDCWRDHVKHILGETHQVAMHSTCPERNCERNINEVVVQAVAPECMPLFENHQRHAFVLGSATKVHWCPGPDCDQVAILPRDNMFEDNVKNFCCGKCSTSFCFTCGQTPHQGICQPYVVMPDQRPEVAVAHAVPALMDTRDDKMRKQCPSCRAPVEKNGGCNRMVCLCRHAFCWLCLGDYSSYGDHFCGGSKIQRRFLLDAGRATVDLEFLRAALRDKPMDDGLVERTQLALEELDRYAHYYNRYYVHKQGQEFAEGQCPCVVNRKENYTQMAGFQTGNEVDFIQSANETLVASRRMLKYAYISAFHSKRVDEEDKEHSHLGFLHLESLEGFTEELSGVSENPLTRHDRARVLDLIVVVAKCMGLLSDFEFHETVANARE